METSPPYPDAPRSLVMSTIRRPAARQAAPLLALAVALLAMLTLLVPRAAFAADPLRLAGTLTDTVGATSGRGDEVERELEAVLDEYGVQVFALFVDTTDDLTVTEYADETARLNSLGADDALVVVAMDDRTDAIWVSESLDAISDAEIDRVMANVLEPSLRDGDFAGAVIASARELGLAASAGPTPQPSPQPTTEPTDPPPDGGSTGGGGLDVGALVGLVLVGVGAVVLARWFTARRAVAREAEERDRRTGKLAREANATLIAVDERIRTAAQEADFVEAEYGPEEAEPFRSALVEARAELREAFAIRQRLDDAEPEDPPTREAMLNDIVERLGRADGSLDRQTARIQELRDLERNAASLLEALPARIGALEERLPAAEATLGGLGGYARSAWEPIAGNPAEARKGLVGAREAVERGRDALARSERQLAARSIHTAQEGLAGAATLLDAVDKLATSVRETDARLADELRSAEEDLAEARAAIGGLRTVVTGGGATSDHAAAVSGAESALRRARQAADARPLDPLAAHRLAVEAHQAADEALAAVRADAEQRAKFAAALEASLTSARVEVDRAADFLATRRNGVGRRARTRLAEAERLLSEASALRAADPKAAMDQARRAQQLAAEAYSLASSDFDSWNQGGPGPTGAGVDVGSVILGSILGGILSGGGRSGGGWGGSPWGSPGPLGGGRRGGSGWGGGGGFGGGRSRGGGFGGFGGGGGRSRGGRW